MAQAPSIDRLLNTVPDAPNLVLEQLKSHPELASKQDGHGYSLLHAAASYGHDALLRALVRDYKVDPNLKDEDGETALFNVEEVWMAKELVALGTDMALPNNDGLTAAQRLDDEDEQPEVAAYLREVAATTPSSTTGVATEEVSSVDHLAQNGGATESHAPPALPNGVHVNLGTMAAEEAGEPDPEFRRRIEELAARPDFQTEQGQRELRNLVTDALSGLSTETRVPPATRRRLD